jgi:hypothetical protein
MDGSNNNQQADDKIDDDIQSLLKLRLLWDLINYDINFWIEIAKKKVEELPEQEDSWNLLGDMLWKLSPHIDSTLLSVESLLPTIQNNKNEGSLKRFYKESGQVIMQIALVIKVTDTLKQMAKPETPLDAEDVKKLIEDINCPINSAKFQSPLHIIQNEMKFRGL